jgi:pimeloyl-ACP methyl ester carboxylesterase
VSGVDRPGSSAAPLLRSRSLHIDGLEFHHLEQGEGPPLLLLHGFPDHAAAWRPLLERLQGSSLRALAPDLRGYRTTSAPTAVEDYRIERLVGDIVALLDAWGLPQAHVCGHDWGGVLAFELARRFPQRVASLVALNAPPPAVLQQMIWHDPRQRAASQYITLLRSPAADPLFHESAVDALIERFLGEPRRRGLLTDADIAAYRDAWTRPGAWRSMLAWYRAAPFEVPAVGAPAPTPPTDAELPPPIDCPVLLIWGERDAVFVPAMADAIAAACRDCRVVRLAEAGHVPHRDEPDRCASLILDFFARHPIRPAVETCPP